MAHVLSATDATYNDVKMEGAIGCRMAELLTSRDGAPTFAMRQFQVEPGGSTPFHAHGWEHEVYILAGSGHLRTAAGPRPFVEGTAILVPPDEQHAFVNDGEGPLLFLCLIPVEQVCCR